MINRLGFNNEGLDAVARRLSSRRRKGLVGANVGANKDAIDALAAIPSVEAELDPYIAAQADNPLGPAPGAHVLMDAVRVCSLGQITHALFEVGGQYRRSM